MSYIFMKMLERKPDAYDAGIQKYSAGDFSKVRKETELPVLVGFGVSTGESAAKIASVSDGVIVGSALLKEIGDESGAAAVERAGSFISGIRKALDD